MVIRGPSGSFSSMTGQNKEYQKLGRESLTSSKMCIKLRSNLDKMDQSLCTAGNCVCVCLCVCVCVCMLVRVCVKTLITIKNQLDTTIRVSKQGGATLILSSWILIVVSIKSLIMCVSTSAGVGRTGVFITLSIVLERMRYEGLIDLFQTVKTLRTQRPFMVQTEVWHTAARDAKEHKKHKII